MRFMRDRLHVSVLLVAILAIALLPEPPPPGQNATAAGPVAPQYAITSLPVQSFRRAAAVQHAVDFILGLQPEGTYILTKPGVNDIVPMDVAHAVIALTKAGYAAEARAAIDWMLALQTRPHEPRAIVTKDVDGQTLTIDYSGSWYDHYEAAALPKGCLSRGRGEAAGLMLVAVGTIVQEDPSYLWHEVAGEPVWAYVARAAHYLSRPALQKPDGRFHHRPDYQVSFNEEGARMTLGLELAADMLDQTGERESAALFRKHAARGFAALRKGEGLSQGMAYDYYALTMWGLVEGAEADAELASLRATGLATPHGVRHYDWQQLQARTMRDRVNWWVRGQIVPPSESFDWGIANIVAGDLTTALQLESAWLPRQRADGSFAGGHLALLGIPVGKPTSYSAARFILFERLLTDAVRDSHRG